MGISGLFTGDELEHQLNLMYSLESKLMPEIDGKKLPKFGYGGAESLYAVEDGNTPNSVFPIFWWPKNANNKNRNPLLERSEL